MQFLAEHKLMDYSLLIGVRRSADPYAATASAPIYVPSANVSATPTPTDSPVLQAGSRTSYTPGSSPEVQRGKSYPRNLYLYIYI